jgi:hypothetical protein
MCYDGVRTIERVALTPVIMGVMLFLRTRGSDRKGQRSFVSSYKNNDFHFITSWPMVTLIKRGASAQASTMIGA